MQPDPASAKHVILCLNSGSSSLKFALYRLGDGEELRLAHGAVERIGLAGGHLWLRGTDNEALVDVHRDFPDHAAAAEGIAAAAKDLGFRPRSPWAIGWSTAARSIRPRSEWMRSSSPSCEGWSPLHPCTCRVPSRASRRWRRAFPGLPTGGVF